MMYWYAVAPDRPEILDVGIRNGLWGVVEDDRDEIDVLEPGDFVLFFHRDDGFVLCEVESEPYTERVPVWTEVDFPHRVRISDPVETDRYAHLGEVHDCLLDPESGEPYSSTATASAALEAAGGTFRPLSDEEIRCLFGRLGWTPPPDVAAAPVEEEDEEPEEAGAEEAGEEAAEEGAADADGPAPPDDEPGEAGEEPPADGEAEPAVAAPADEGPEPAEAEPATAEPAEEDESAPVEAEPVAEEEPDEEAEATSTRVILAPAAGNEASRRRWEETVEEGAPVDRLEGHLPDDELETLREASEDGRVRVWGTAPARDEGSRAQWSDSGAGDVLLFTGGGEIFASARVLAKRRDPELAEELWGRRDDGDTWEFLFFATEPLRQGVPYEAFNEVAGYEAGYRIPRLNILETERSLRILGAFPEFALVPREDEEDAADEAPDAEAEEPDAPAEDAAAGEEPAEAEPATQEPAAADEVDGPAERAGDEAPAEAEAADEGPEPAEAEGAEEEPEAPDPDEGAEPAPDEAAAAEPPDDAPEPAADTGVGPMDEDRLRTLLFGRRELGRCALCGLLLPVELLDVVYVKPLDACDPDELEDVGNDVFPGCRLGCAGLFRQGYLVVEEGVVRPGRDEPLTEPAEERIDEVVGNRCEYWHSGSEPYFRWHAAESRDR